MYASGLSMYPGARHPGLSGAPVNTPSETVLLIGGGRMGGALLKGWLSAKRFSAIHVIEPQPSPSLAALGTEGRIVLHDRLNAETLPKPTAIVLAVKPQILKSQGALLRSLHGTHVPIVSIAAGVTLAFLKAGAGADARLVRAMPNTPGAIGQGITVLCAEETIGAADREFAEVLMAGLGETLWLEDESLMDAVTALSGSGPAYVFLLAEAHGGSRRSQDSIRTSRRKTAARDHFRRRRSPRRRCGDRPRNCARKSPAPAAPPKQP